MLWLAVFAKLSPQQKARIGTMLRENRRIEGFPRDGIDDASAMSVADVGISVDTAVDIAKESADIMILPGENAHYISCNMKINGSNSRWMSRIINTKDLFWRQSPASFQRHYYHC